MVDLLFSIKGGRFPNSAFSIFNFAIAQAIADAAANARPSEARMYVAVIAGILA